MRYMLSYSHSGDKTRGGSFSALLFSPLCYIFYVMSSPPVKKKNPLIALILSGLLPGLGQIYNNQIAKGLLLFAANILITVLAYGPFQVMLSSFKSPEDLSQDMPALLMLLGYSLAGLVVLLYAMFDAFKTAGRINDRA